MNVRTKAQRAATALLAADFGATGLAALFGAPFMLDALSLLSYPRYFGVILGAWKVLGAIAIVARVSPRLTEWAYAGMFFDLTGAIVSHLAVGDGPAAVAAPCGVLALWAVSWWRSPDADGARTPGPGAETPRLDARNVPGSAALLALAYAIVAALTPTASAQRRAPRESTRAPSTSRDATPPEAAEPSLQDAQAVVAFWRDAGPSMWFAKDAAFDQRFRERFLALHEAAARGALDPWAATPEGALALVILLDQFPRNAFRGTPRMYATDARARAVADHAVRAGHDLAIAAELRLFVYLPFGHSEDIVDQERSVALAATLGEPSLSRAQHHRDIVRRFGRFPHRNHILGRPTRPEEQRYLDEGGYQG